MLPRETEMVFDWTGMQGSKVQKRFEQSWGLDTALYKNLNFTVIEKVTHTIPVAHSER